MHVVFALASLALLVTSAHAGVYITNPVASSALTGGQSIDVTWRDDGQPPLLSAIGECTVGLYTGDLVQVQALPSVDVSTTQSLTFTVDPSSGPNGPYYLVFSAAGISYQSFSATFSLSGMTGTLPSSGSSVPATSPTGTTTGTAPSGTSASAGSTTAPTGSTSATDTTAASTPSASPTLTTPTLSTPTATASSPTTTPRTTTTTTTTRTTSSTSSTASATASNAAGHTGSSVSLGGIAALFALSGVLAF